MNDGMGNSVLSLCHSYDAFFTEQSCFRQMSDLRTHWLLIGSIGTHLFWTAGAVTLNLQDEDLCSSVDSILKHFGSSDMTVVEIG